jgi:hypothetical protein
MRVQLSVGLTWREWNLTGISYLFSKTTRRTLDTPSLTSPRSKQSDLSPGVNSSLEMKLVTRMHVMTRSKMWGATPLHIPCKPYDVHKYKFTFPVFIASLLQKTESIVAIKFIKNSQLYEKLVQQKLYSNGITKAYIHYLKHFCVNGILTKTQ